MLYCESIPEGTLSIYPCDPILKIHWVSNEGKLFRTNRVPDPPFLTNISTGQFHVVYGECYSGVQYMHLYCGLYDVLLCHRSSCA